MCLDEWWDLVEDLEGDALNLSAKVAEAPPAEESNSSAYAGVAFGLVAAIAAGALYRNRNKKINANQERLLWVAVSFQNSFTFWRQVSIKFLLTNEILTISFNLYLI